MKKILLGCLLGLVLIFSGCSWTDGSYTYVTPHVGQESEGQKDISYLHNKKECCTSLSDLIAEGQEQILFFLDSSYSAAAFEKDFPDIQRFICEEDPLGTYAIDQISYEIGSNSGKDAVSFTVDYRHNRSEIKAIPVVNSMEDVQKAILNSLERYDSGLVIMVKNYEEMDVSQLVEDYSMEYPDLIMEVPTVTASVYSDSGRTRLLEIGYQYQTSRETLRNMKEQAARIFESAQLYVSKDALDAEKYSQLYRFLTQRHDYRIETSITATYSLLRYGVGNSRAFATVFAAMCEQSGLPCMIVSGTKDGNSHFWNMICIDENFYHLDLLRCIEDGEFEVQTDSEMQNYVWNYSAYPACVEQFEEETIEHG